METTIRLLFGRLKNKLKLFTRAINMLLTELDQSISKDSPLHVWMGQLICGMQKEANLYLNKPKLIKAGFVL